MTMNNHTTLGTANRAGTWTHCTSSGSSNKFPKTWTHHCTGYCSGNRADFDVRYQSVNRDDIEVHFDWCSDDDYDECALYGNDDSSNNLAQHFSHSYTNGKYRQNAPKIEFVCKNWAQDCQIELESLSITCH